MEHVLVPFGKSGMLSDVYGMCGVNEKYLSDRSFSLLENSHECLKTHRSSKV